MIKLLAILGTVAIIGIGIFLMAMLSGQSRSKLKMGAVFLAVVCLVSAQWVLYQGTYNSQLRVDERYAQKMEQSRKSASADCDNSGLAYVMSQTFVRRSLASPSTAAFPSSAVRVERVGGCRFIIAAYVDSQNGFGAVVRTSYVASLEYLPNSSE